MKVKEDALSARGFVAPSLVDAGGARSAFGTRHNTLSFMSAEAMAAAFGGDPSYIPARIGFIYGVGDHMPSDRPITRRQSWDDLKTELSAGGTDDTVDVQVVGFSYSPTLGGVEEQGGDDSSGSDSSDSPSGEAQWRTNFFFDAEDESVPAFTEMPVESIPEQIGLYEESTSVKAWTSGDGMWLIWQAGERDGSAFGEWGFWSYPGAQRLSPSFPPSPAEDSLELTFDVQGTSRPYISMSRDFPPGVGWTAQAQDDSSHQTYEYEMSVDQTPPDGIKSSASAVVLCAWKAEGASVWLSRQVLPDMRHTAYAWFLSVEGGAGFETGSDVVSQADAEALYFNVGGMSYELGRTESAPSARRDAYAPARRDAYASGQSGGDYGGILPTGSNAITFHAVSNSQKRGGMFGRDAFVGGDYLYQAVLLGLHNGKYYVLSRVSLMDNGAYLTKPSGFEVALDWTIVFK